MTEDELIQKIEEHARSAGLAPATITKNAVGNSRLYERLLIGHSCTLTIANRILSYIAASDAKIAGDAEKKGAAA